MNTLVTDEMVEAAVRKAVEAGLLPRHACRQDTEGYQELIRYVLQAAIEAAPSKKRIRQKGAQTGGKKIRERLAEVRDMAHWLHGYAQN